MAGRGSGLEVSSTSTAPRLGVLMGSCCRYRKCQCGLEATNPSGDSDQYRVFYLPGLLRDLVPRSMCRRTLTGGQYGHLSAMAPQKRWRKKVRGFDTWIRNIYFSILHQMRIKTKIFMFIMFNVQWLFNSTEKLFNNRGSEKRKCRLHAIVIFFETEQLFTAVKQKVLK